MSRIPDDLVHNKELNELIRSSLPWNYNFEVHKTLWRIRQAKATVVAMQFPEGLLMYAPLLSDILQIYGKVETIIMADVAYGACCIDDYSAAALGADFLVHYGHSCLVPIDRCVLDQTMYVFVEIKVDVKHFVDTVKLNLPVAESKVVFAGTIQFVGAIHEAMEDFKAHFSSGEVIVPQAKPLSKGEILGCTAPKLQEDVDAIVFLSDGRFHLEALMIQNPHVKRVFKYDPYLKKLTVEEYKHEEMHSLRREAIAKAIGAKKFGLILGTLGRQGNPEIMQRLEKCLEEKNISYVCVLLSEVMPQKLAMFQDVDAWVQIACPRLSVDWGYAYPKPLLTPYEAFVCLEETRWNPVYPMDNYSRNTGVWGNYYKDSSEIKNDGLSEEAPVRKKLTAKERIMLARRNRQVEKIEIQMTD